MHRHMSDNLHALVYLNILKVGGQYISSILEMRKLRFIEYK